MLRHRQLPLSIGDVFTTKTGKRKLVAEGDHLFAVFDHRRYWCRCISAKNDHYRDQFNRPQLRCSIRLCVVEA